MKYIIKSDIATITVKKEGAMLTSLKKDNREYLWQGNPSYWAGQAPVCFPIVGVLKDSKAIAFGKDCEMKRHGVARINPFELKEKTDDSVTFIQYSSEKTKKQYPFDYILEIKYTIKDDTVSTEYTVKNTGSGKMPFVIGGHPAFNCPLSSNENFEDYKVVFNKKVTKYPLRPDHKTGLVDVEKRYDVLKNDDTLYLKHDLFYDDALIFDNVEAKTATLIGKNGFGIKIEYEKMTNLLIWSAENDAPFVALEPWSGISNCSDENEVFENKRGMTILSENEEKTFSFSITMI